MRWKQIDGEGFVAAGLRLRNPAVLLVAVNPPGRLITAVASAHFI
jgi:hypothetical protein